MKTKTVPVDTVSDSSESNKEKTGKAAKEDGITGATKVERAVLHLKYKKKIFFKKERNVSHILHDLAIKTASIPPKFKETTLQRAGDLSHESPSNWIGFSGIEKRKKEKRKMEISELKNPFFPFPICPLEK